METFKRTPLQLFNLPQHFVIPLFQRPYVWKEDEQWEPLWKDIRRIAKLRIDAPHLNATHFLGAVVIQSHEAQTEQLTTWNVIDGQQRLTTLQIFADAACALLAQSGNTQLAGQLEHLTHNDAFYVEEGHIRLKVRHLNKDQAAFDEVMSAEPPVDHTDLAHSDSQIVAAHGYFSTVVEQWLGPPESDEYTLKAKNLTDVLLKGLQLVSIELDASENSQEIFETLNARGTPLTAADLVRNFVFKRLEAEGANTKKAYKEDWPFETKFWTKEVSVGRNLISRSSLFLNQWLVARTGEEISPQATFSRFKSYVELESGHKMTGLKRSALMDHNTITLTGRVIKRTEHHAWDEELIDERTAELIDRILQVWPVPEGHHGKVIDPQTKAGDWVELKHLIEAGLLAPGDKLVATHRDFKGREATLTAAGAIELAGKRYTSPSAAGHALRKKATNGWYFWSVADGRRLRDVRTQFQNSMPADEELKPQDG